MANTTKRARRPDGLLKASITTGRSADGKPIKKYFYAKTQKELDRKTAGYRLQMQHGTLSANENSTFGELAAVWLRDYKPMIGARMRQTYASICKNHLSELSTIKCKDLKPAHLQGIINLGHADIQVTLKIYTHLSQAKKQRSIDALNALISAEVAPLIGGNLK